MRKLSQKELLTEGFFDRIRAAAAAVRPSPAASNTDSEYKQAARDIKSGTISGIKKIGRGIAKTAAAASKLDKEGFGILKEPLSKFVNSDPKAFTKQALESNYFTTFNTKTIKIISSRPDTTAKTPRTIVMFTAERYKPAGGTIPKSNYFAYVIKGPKGLQMDVRDEKGNSIQGEKKRNTNTTQPQPVQRRVKNNRSGRV